MVSPTVVGLVKVTRTSRQMRSLRRESRVFDLTIEWRNFFTLRGQIWLLNFILKFIEGVFGGAEFSEDCCQQFSSRDSVRSLAF